MSGTSTCESLTRNAKIPEIARKSGCGGIGIRARLRCVWHYVLASSSLAIRIEYIKQLLTVLAVGSCFILSGFSRKSIEYRRVRIHQISLSAIELLTDPHDTRGVFYQLSVPKTNNLVNPPPPC